MAGCTVGSKPQKQSYQERCPWSNETSRCQKIRERKEWTSGSVFHAPAFRRGRLVPHISIPTPHSVLIDFQKMQGDATPGDPATFTSLTELQYDRLVKWSEGYFAKNKEKNHVPESFDLIAVEDQPTALTKAALEATIGAPLFPGIEISWNAEKSSTYNLDRPFTINDNVLPGDLTKYLSLPWQSDFYQCRSNW